jgi:hypothetical protein
MSRTFIDCKSEVKNRGRAPDPFLNELIDWALTAQEEIFEENANHDIYSNISQTLGPFVDLKQRKAAMLEALRVLGGFESSWRWTEGRDTTNPDSNLPCTEEAGIFQCSGNSMKFDPSLRQLLLDTAGDSSCEQFISTTKTNHRFAIEYCARLLRYTVDHHGPVKHNKINPYLSKAAMQEFLSFLA